jgi:hypothetical protein
MESKLEKIAHLKLQIEELQNHIRDDADRIKDQVIQHQDHPGGIQYILELADRIKRDAQWVQERFDEIKNLEASRGIEAPNYHRTKGE